MPDAIRTRKSHLRGRDCALFLERLTSWTREFEGLICRIARSQGLSLRKGDGRLPGEGVKCYWSQ
jgi:hypothetical protein